MSAPLQNHSLNGSIEGKSNLSVVGFWVYLAVVQTLSPNLVLASALSKCSPVLPTSQKSLRWVQVPSAGNLFPSFLLGSHVAKASRKSRIQRAVKLTSNSLLRTLTWSSLLAETFLCGWPPAYQWARRARRA